MLDIFDEIEENWWNATVKSIMLHWWYDDPRKGIWVFNNGKFLDL